MANGVKNCFVQKLMPQIPHNYLAPSYGFPGPTHFHIELQAKGSEVEMVKKEKRKLVVSLHFDERQQQTFEKKFHSKVFPPSLPKSHKTRKMCVDEFYVNLHVSVKKNRFVVCAFARSSHFLKVTHWTYGWEREELLVFSLLLLVLSSTCLFRQNDNNVLDSIKNKLFIPNRC